MRFYDRIPRQVKVLTFLGTVLTLAILFAIFRSTVWHWIEVDTGTINEPGPYYGFWSGFGSDLGEATLVAGLLAVFRHHNCHVRGCARLGRPVDGTPYLACPKHHPTHKGAKRGVAADTIHRAHATGKR
jgi:hypothetical protein